MDIRYLAVGAKRSSLIKENEKVLTLCTNFIYHHDIISNYPSTCRPSSSVNYLIFSNLLFPDLNHVLKSPKEIEIRTPYSWRSPSSKGQYSFQCCCYESFSSLGPLYPSCCVQYTAIAENAKFIRKFQRRHLRLLRNPAPDIGSLLFGILYYIGVYGKPNFRIYWEILS